MIYKMEQMSIRQVIVGTNWELLKKQKLVLMQACDKFPELEGILNWIDEIQDAAEAEGCPVQWLEEAETEAETDA